MCKVLFTLFSLEHIGSWGWHQCFNNFYLYRAREQDTNYIYRVSIISVTFLSLNLMWSLSRYLSTVFLVIQSTIRGLVQGVSHVLEHSVFKTKHLRCLVWALVRGFERIEIKYWALVQYFGLLLIMFVIGQSSRQLSWSEIVKEKFLLWLNFIITRTPTGRSCVLGMMPKKIQPSLHVTNHFGITKLKNYWQKQPQMPHGLSNCVGESMGCIIMWLRVCLRFTFQVWHSK